MKPPGVPKRKKPLKANTELKRNAWLHAKAPLARSALARNSGEVRQKPKMAAPKRRDTGPSAKVRRLVRERSGGWCEFPDCFAQATEPHHRLNRKSGGRHGEMAVRINQAAWLLDSCRRHNAQAANAVNPDLQLLRDRGLLLMEGEDARLKPVVSRHGRVWLRDDGTFSTNPPAEEAAA